MKTKLLIVVVILTMLVTGIVAYTKDNKIDAFCDEGGYDACLYADYDYNLNEED